MDHNMFCFQCEQTAGCTGCTSRGVCGKDAQTRRRRTATAHWSVWRARRTPVPTPGPETGS